MRELRLMPCASMRLVAQRVLFSLCMLPEPPQNAAPHILTALLCQVPAMSTQQFMAPMQHLDTAPRRSGLLGAALAGVAAGLCVLAFGVPSIQTYQGLLY